MRLLQFGWVKLGLKSRKVLLSSNHNQYCENFSKLLWMSQAVKLPAAIPPCLYWVMQEEQDPKGRGLCLCLYCKKLQNPYCTIRCTQASSWTWSSSWWRWVNEVKWSHRTSLPQCNCAIIIHVLLHPVIDGLSIQLLVNDSSIICQKIDSTFSSQ